MFKKLLAAALLFAFGIGAADAGDPRTDPNTMMIGVFYQDPLSTGVCGGCGTNLGTRFAAMGMNTVIGMAPSSDWPIAVGADRGEMAAIHAAGLYLIAGAGVPYTENASKHSVSSIISLATAQSALSNLIGYDMSDEPQCGGSGAAGIENVSTIVSNIAGYDATRIAYINYLPQSIVPLYLSAPCLTSTTTAWKATTYLSFDQYPMTHPYQGGLTGSDFISTPWDAIWRQGLLVTSMQHYGNTDQPLWAFVESGGDNQGVSSANPYVNVTTTSGSTTLVNNSGGATQFTSSWVGLTVSGTGLQSATTIASITDSTHAVMSKPASGNGSVTATVSGGSGGGDCVVSVNLCVAHGNRYRPTPVEVNGEVWNSIISGATGIQWFCHDLTSYQFCAGDSAGGADATAAASNITYINGILATYAPMIKATTSGICSMQTMNYSTQAYPTTSSCNNGILTIATGDSALPGLAKLTNYGSDYYLFVQSDRRSATGATFTMTLSGLNNYNVTTLWDSNARYDPGHSTATTVTTTNGSGIFTDTFGANNNHYQVRVYKITAPANGGGGGTTGRGHGRGRGH